MASHRPLISTSSFPSIVLCVCSRSKSGASIRKVPVAIPLISIKEFPTHPSELPEMSSSSTAFSGTSPYSTPTALPHAGHAPGSNP